MTRDHTLIEELLSADALDGLDLEDRAMLERLRGEHGSCEDCTRLEIEFLEVAGRLGFALAPIPVRVEMADEILARAGDTPSSVGAVDLTRGRFGNWRAVVAVAALFLFFVGGGILFGLTRGHEKIAVFRGAAAKLQMTFTPGKSGAELRGSNFAALPSGEVYELWAIRGGTPIRTACFRPLDGDVQLSIGAALRSTDVMAVTVESAACPTTPTTAPILKANLAQVF